MIEGHRDPLEILQAAAPQQQRTEGLGAGAGVGADGQIGGACWHPGSCRTCGSVQQIHLVAHPQQRHPRRHQGLQGLVLGGPTGG